MSLPGPSQFSPVGCQVVEEGSGTDNLVMVAEGPGFLFRMVRIIAGEALGMRRVDAGWPCGWDLRFSSRRLTLQRHLWRSERAGCLWKRFPGPWKPGTGDRGPRAGYFLPPEHFWLAFPQSGS